VIDPIIAYSTYLGGSSVDEALAVAVDNSGAVVVTGQTYSGDFPTTIGAFDRTVRRMARAPARSTRTSSSPS